MRVFVLSTVALAAMLAAAQIPVTAATYSQDPQAAPVRPAPPAGCRVTGTVTAGNTPLPGVAIVVKVGETVKAATSSDAEGKFTILFGPNATYHVTADMMAFGSAERDLTLGALPCDQTLDFKLSLQPRGALPAVATSGAAAGAANPPSAGAAGATGTSATGAAATTGAGAGATGAAATTASATTGAGTQGATGARTGGAGNAGRAGGAGQTATVGGATRFQTLNVQANTTGQAVIDATPPDTGGDLARFLPSGFSAQGAGAEAVAINGATDAINVNRAALNDRFNAIGRGEFDPATGQFAAGFGPPGGAGGDNPFGAGGDAAGGRGGRGGGAGGGGGGGRGGFGQAGGFQLGGRGGRGQNPYSGSANYTFGGSALDATNIQPRSGVITPVSSLPFDRNNFGATFGGPVRIPGLYADTNRRTSFQFNYSGNHSTQLQDQYATVPTADMRAGNFAGSAIQLVDPHTGLPYANNQIPAGAMDPTALALLQYIPLPNVEGAGLTQNYHHADTTLSTSNSVSVRFTQNLSPTLPQRGGGPGRGGAGGGRGGGAGGGGGGGGRGGAGGRAGGRGLSINLTAQLQYRENDGEQFNAIPILGGTTKGTTIAAPISVTISKGRVNQNLSFQWNHSSNTSGNAFTNTTNVAGDAGVLYPPGNSTDPLNWGMPNLTFSQFSVRQPAASSRSDDRMSLGYSYSRPVHNNKHQLRIGADFRHDLSTSEVNGNARGTFTFTGLYTSLGQQTSTGSGSDFADFLLGLPQQASLQVGGTTKLKQNSWDVSLEDNWQKSAKLTLSLGLRYEAFLPYVETGSQMANLDVNPDFTAATVVLPNQVGPYSGLYPASLVNTDWNNVGPRFGFGYRLARNTILRGGYSITYNSGSYSSIAQKLVGQPPFANTATNIGTIVDPLTIETGLIDATGTLTNNFGIDKNYGLGMIQTWNATLTKDLFRNYTITVGYTGTKGTNLDLLRAPNRNPDGTLRIEDVQAFIWESSGGHSILSLGNFQVRRRLTKGFSAGVNYTVAKSMDNGGAGSSIVAQNDHDLQAEWALSNFDQRQNVSGDIHYELPFGVGRKWLTEGGFVAAIVGEWTMDMTMSAFTGSPLTVRVNNATSSVANGTSGSLRANYNGQPISISDPTLLQFFNTGVFSIPAPGDYGTSPRNIVTGPGGHTVNANFSRDMRLSGNRSVSIGINCNNIFNTIQWTAIDTNINSRTFGYVTRFAPMRAITANLRLRF